MAKVIPPAQVPPPTAKYVVRNPHSEADKKARAAKGARTKWAKVRAWEAANPGVPRPVTHSRTARPKTDREARLWVMLQAKGQMVFWSSKRAPSVWIRAAHGLQRKGLCQLEVAMCDDGTEMVAVTPTHVYK